jgi:adenosine deaminase
VSSKKWEVQFSRQYQGYYNEKSMGGLNDTWERVMNTALERMVEEMSTDPKLIETLQKIQGPGSS